MAGALVHQLKTSMQKQHMFMFNSSGILELLETHGI